MEQKNRQKNFLFFKILIYENKFRRGFGLGIR